MRTALAKNHALNYATKSKATIEGIVGAGNLAEIWYGADAANGLVSGRVQTWTGRRRGIVLTAPSAAQRPTYTASNPDVGGKPTVDAATALSKCLAWSGTAFILTGQRPGLYAIGRLRSAVAVQGSFDVVAQWRSTSEVLSLSAYPATDAGNVSARYETNVASSYASNLAQGVFDIHTRAQFLGARIDGVDGLSIVRDGQLAATNAAAVAKTALTGGVTNIIFGADVSSVASNFSAAVFFLTYETLTPAQLAALANLQAAQYATPAIAAFPLPAGASALWDARYGIGLGVPGRVQTWTDQVGSRVISAPASSQRPVLATEQEIAVGKMPAIKANLANTRGLLGTSLAQFAAVGTRPALLFVTRQRVKAASGIQVHVTLESNNSPSGDRNHYQLTARGDGAGSEYWYAHKNCSGSAQDIITGDVQDTVTDVWEFISNGSTGFTVYLDGVQLGNLTNASTVGVISAIQQHIGVGISTSGSSPGDISALIVAHLTVEPSAPERAAYLAWAKTVGIPYLPALPSTIVEVWHGDMGSQNNAVGQVAAKSLTKAGTALAASTPGYGNGRLAYQCFFTGTKYWGNRALGTVLASGTRPWLFVVGRFRSVTDSANRVMFAIGANGVQSHYVLQLDSSNRVVLAINNGAVVVIGPAADTDMHRFKCWADGTNAHLMIDDTDYTAAYTGSLPQNVDAICIGSTAHTGAFEGNCDVYFAEVCSAKPSAGEETTQDNYAKAFFASN